MNRTLTDFTPSAANQPAPRQSAACAGSDILHAMAISADRLKYYADMRASIAAVSGVIVGGQP